MQVYVFERRFIERRFIAVIADLNSHSLKNGRCYMVLFMMFKSPTVITYHPSPERLHGYVAYVRPRYCSIRFWRLGEKINGAQRYGTCHPKMAYLVVCLTKHAGQKLQDV